MTKAVAAVPKGVKKIGETASKVKAAIPKYINIAKQTNVGQGVVALKKEVNTRNQRILKKLELELEQNYPELVRGVT